MYLLILINFFFLNVFQVAEDKTSYTKEKKNIYLPDILAWKGGKLWKNYSEIPQRQFFALLYGQERIIHKSLKKSQQSNLKTLSGHTIIQ